MGNQLLTAKDVAERLQVNLRTAQRDYPFNPARECGEWEKERVSPGDGGNAGEVHRGTHRPACAVVTREKAGNHGTACVWRKQWEDPSPEGLSQLGCTGKQNIDNPGKRRYITWVSRRKASRLKALIYKHL